MRHLKKPEFGTHNVAKAENEPIPKLVTLFWRPVNKYTEDKNRQLKPVGR